MIPGVITLKLISTFSVKSIREFSIEISTSFSFKCAIEFYFKNFVSFCSNVVNRLSLTGAGCSFRIRSSSETFSFLVLLNDADLIHFL